MSFSMKGPSFTDIINCACDTSDRSSKSYKRFAKDVKERLIECMFGGAQFPMSILNAAFHKVTRPMGYDNIRVWRRDFEIACSLWKNTISMKQENSIDRRM